MPKNLPSLKVRQLIRLLESAGCKFYREGKADHKLYVRYIDGNKRAVPNITLENIYKMVVALQHDVALIKQSLIEEPELRDDFVLRMRDIDLEKAIIVEDFGKRYGLK